MSDKSLQHMSPVELLAQCPTSDNWHEGLANSEVYRRLRKLAEIEAMVKPGGDVEVFTLLQRIGRD